jgi:hypothetical protein
VFQRTTSLAILLALSGVLLGQCVICGPDAKGPVEHDCCKPVQPAHCGGTKPAPDNHHQCPHRPAALESYTKADAGRDPVQAPHTVTAAISVPSIDAGLPAVTALAVDITAAVHSPPELYLRNLTLLI